MSETAPQSWLYVSMEGGKAPSSVPPLFQVNKPLQWFYTLQHSNKGENN